MQYNNNFRSDIPGGDNFNSIRVPITFQNDQNQNQVIPITLVISIEDSPNSFSQSTKTYSQKDLICQKLQALENIALYRKRGYATSRDFSMEDSYEDLDMERNRLRELCESEAHVTYLKNALLMFVTFVEMTNNEYNPFNLDLTGWSEELHSRLDNFEPVLEEIYEKYKGHTVQLSPEVKLILMLTGSLISFHFSQQLLKKMQTQTFTFSDLGIN